MTVSDSTARRAAKQVGYVATKSRWRKDSVDNFGGFMLLDAYTNIVVNGSRFQLTAADVVSFCTGIQTARSTIARKGGCTKTKAKSAAARRN